MTRVIEYVGLTTTAVQDRIDGIVEDVIGRGFSVVNDVLSGDECADWSARLDRLNRAQEEAFGAERLDQLQDRGVVRGMLADDSEFLRLVRHPATWPVIERILGATAILHLQNGIIVEHGLDHHQAAFHRDFAKDFVADRPLSINAFFLIDDFTAQTGATWWVPSTHGRSSFPSLRYLEENAVQIEARAGAVVFFDSLLIHRAGENRSGSPRRAINHQYTRPFIKQQIDYPALLRGNIDADSALAQTLGFWSVPPRSVAEFRVDPEHRTYRRGQG